MKMNQLCEESCCLCPVRDFVSQQTRCFSFDDVIKGTRCSPGMIRVCLGHMEIYDFVCKDGELWCPDLIQPTRMQP